MSLAHIAAANKKKNREESMKLMATMKEAHAEEIRKIRQTHAEEIRQNQDLATWSNHTISSMNLRLKELTGENTTLSGEIEALKLENAALKEESATLQDQKKKLTQDKCVEKIRFEEQNNQLQLDLQTSGETIMALQKQIQKTETTHKKEKDAKMRATKYAVSNAEVELIELRKQCAELRAKFDDAHLMKPVAASTTTTTIFGALLEIGANVNNALGI